ncbi:MAG: YdcF family protein [Parcubacteria group bacterium]|nr:YdcF family protein [Parcubacteria group bacterium]
MRSDDDKLGVLVCGYGTDLTANGYYLYFILFELIKLSKQHKEIVVIASGGETNKKSRPGKTEADMIADYLDKNLVYHGINNVKILRERIAYTIRQNLEESSHGFKFEFRMRHLPRNIVVICKQSHVLKVKLLSSALWGFIPRIIHFEERLNFKETIKQKIAAFLSLAGVWIPPIANMELERKERIINES